MARFGRGTPHQPIILRTAMAALVYTATIPNVHVVSLAAIRIQRNARSTQLAPAGDSLAPLASKQPLVIGAADIRHSNRPERAGAVLLVRNPQAPVPELFAAPAYYIVSPAAWRQPRPGVQSPILERNAPALLLPPAQRPVIVSCAAIRVRQEPPAQPLLQRNAQEAAPPPDQPPAIRTHVLLQLRHGARPFVPTGAIVLRDYGIPTTRAKAPIVASLATERFQPERRAAVQIVRPSPTSLVPDRPASQIHIVLCRRQDGFRLALALVRDMRRGAASGALASPGLTFIGKYKPEHDAALDAIQRLPSFASDHAAVLQAIRDAGV